MRIIYREVFVLNCILCILNELRNFQFWVSNHSFQLVIISITNNKAKKKMAKLSTGLRSCPPGSAHPQSSRASPAGRHDT